jgi:hypothetical protein
MGTTTTQKLKVCMTDFNGVIAPFYDVFEPMELESLLETGDKKADALLVWNDILPIFQEMCVVANKSRIPTFMMQHGRRSMSDYLPTANPKAQPIANVVFVWGEADKEMAIKGGWKPEQVFRVGAPFFRYLLPREEQKGTVVFNALHWDKEVIGNYKVWSKLKEIKDIVPIAKLLTQHDPNKFGGKVMRTSQQDPNAVAATMKLLSTASCLVTLIEDTLTLFAYAMDIPVVFVKDMIDDKILLGRKLDEGQYDPTDAAHLTSLEKLPDTIAHILAHPEEKRHQRAVITLQEAGNKDSDSYISTTSAIMTELVKVYAK